MKFKKENIYILKARNESYPERRVEIQARTFEYKGHKFNLQGNYNSGYNISDNNTGMIIGGIYTINRIKDVESEYVFNILDKFIEIAQNKKEFYQGAIERFNNAPIIEEVA